MKDIEINILEIHDHLYLSPLRLSQSPFFLLFFGFSFLFYPGSSCRRVEIQVRILLIILLRWSRVSSFLVPPTLNVGMLFSSLQNLTIACFQIILPPAKGAERLAAFANLLDQSTPPIHTLSIGLAFINT